MPSFLNPLRKIMGSKVQPDEEGVAPLDVIFSCSVCGDTFADVYNGHSTTVEGLSDGINPKDRLVTRLYVSSCCHVICIKHIEGGNGPPFHPAGSRPRAPCPVCIQEGGEDRPRELYSVRGFKEDEHDPAIPKYWFSAPPIKLDGKDKEMEALRFQYLALIRYGKNITGSQKKTVQLLGESEHKLRSMQDLASAEHAKVLSLEDELERLRPLEHEVRKLHRLQARLPAIEHYLRLLPKLAEQNDLMKQRLASVGFQMALEPIPNFKEPFPLDGEGNFVDGIGNHAFAELQRSASSHTVGRSAHKMAYTEEAGTSSSPRTSRPLKRPRVESPLPGANIHVAPSSRDLMPPPSKPLSRMKSMRKIIPSIRKKFSNNYASPVTNGKVVVEPDIQMYEGGQWEAVEEPTQPSSDRERPPTRHGLRQETPYMSGALPVENPQQTCIAPEPQSLPSIGMRNNQSEFTFRSHSPIKLDSRQPNNLPTERSYIRLLDGLNDHTGLDLGLQDPRERDPGDSSSQRNGYGRVAHQDSNSREQTQKKRWDFGPSNLGRMSNGTSLAGNDIERNWPNGVNNTNSQARNAKSINSITPAPARFQRPVEERDNVVSPYFGGNDGYSQTFSRGGITEQNHSSNHFDGYPYHRQKLRLEPDWREPRSLNGLSFFNSPLNERNERIDYRHRQGCSDHSAPDRHYQGRNLDSRGFITRPEVGGSPYLYDSTYGSSDRAFSRQGPSHSKSSIPFPPFSRSSQSRASRLPAAMPSIISSQSHVRQQPRSHNLEQVGVRSSRNQMYIQGNTYATPARHLFSSSGRRSIRR